MIISLDLALDTGWALMLQDGTIQTGVWHIREDCDANPGSSRSPMPAVLVRKCLSQKLRIERVTHVVFESAIARGGPSIWIQNTMQCAVMSWCLEWSIPFSRVGPTSWKKAMCRNGSTSKTDYHLKAIEKWPALDIKTDHEAAALWMLLWLQQEHLSCRVKR
jgi:hypothetical protein